MLGRAVTMIFVTFILGAIAVIALAPILTGNPSPAADKR
jgi:hypothetical protein